MANHIQTSKIAEEYQQRLLGFIRKRTSTDCANDILQDVLLKVYTQIDNLKDTEKIESWLFQISRNAIADYYRQHKMTEALPEWIEDIEDEQTIIDQHELTKCLIPMIDQLPKKYKKAIRFTELSGNKQNDFARLEGISLSGAKSRIQRGRQLLKGMLHQCCELEMNHQNQVISYHVKNPNKVCC